uniref:Uncharacterized protein n=1 Tax=viral metagenome TaxID=1070528 RepID=A0A6C0JCL4_9ZZZZ|tara:strand:+ start:597 stop:1145 length:549 start_codon:yes stop_codon:yes gene_type:complete
MDLSQNNQVDLLYLTNPNFKIKYNKEKIRLINDEDIKFYRKRILQDTKAHLRGHTETLDITNAFERFAMELINYYKFIDKQKLIQEEYKNLPKKISKKPENFKLLEENELIMNKPSVIKKTIKDFIPIVVRERSHRKIVIPKVKTYDLKNIKNREKEKSNQFITDGKKTEKGKNEKGKNEKG